MLKAERRERKRKSKRDKFPQHGKSSLRIQLEIIVKAVPSPANQEDKS
jgi:hypothetical protein